MQLWTRPARSSGSSRSRPSSSQRPSGPGLLSGTSGRPSLSVGARHSARRGPSRTNGSGGGSLAAAVPERRSAARRSLDLALPPRDLVARRRPLGRLAQEEAERDVLVPGHVERDVLALPRRRVQRRQVASLPLTAQVRQVDEVVAVVDPEPPGARVERLHADGRRQVLELVHRRVRRAVGPHEAVGAEVRVVRRLAEVAAVRPVLAPALVRAADPVVDPLPDEAALQRVVAVEGGVVVGQAAVAVAHRVRVLAQDQRARVVAVVRGRPRLDRVDVGVHRADDVGRAPAAATSRARSRPRSAAAATGREPRSQPAAASWFGPVAALVAERPQDHARVVLVALDHVLHALDERVRVARVGAQARRSTRATRCSPRRSRTGRTGRRGRASTGRSDSASVRTALTLNCFISRTSASISSRVTARPRASSWSWRLTPAISTALAVDEQPAVADLDAAEADRGRRRSRRRRRARACRAPAPPPTTGAARAPRRRAARLGSALVEHRVARRGSISRARLARPAVRTSTTSRPSMSPRANTSPRRARRRRTSTTERGRPACHHWSWSSTKLASDQLDDGGDQLVRAVVANELA